jgi:hypothetical protein
VQRRGLQLLRKKPSRINTEQVQPHQLQRGGSTATFTAAFDNGVIEGFVAGADNSRPVGIIEP